MLAHSIVSASYLLQCLVAQFVIIQFAHDFLSFPERLFTLYKIDPPYDPFSSCQAAALLLARPANRFMFPFSLSACIYAWLAPHPRTTYKSFYTFSRAACRIHSPPHTIVT
jgi:hypothetical protein